MPCGGSACPINCKVGPWQYLNASPCSLSCGTGSQTVRRAVTQLARHNGAACPALEKSVPCNQQPCPTDCAPDTTYYDGEWDHWSPCREENGAQCGDGRKTRTRKFIMPTFGGKSCPPDTQVSDCNLGPCPVHCDVSDWGTWSLCTVTCGTGGSRWRERSSNRSTSGTATSAPSCGTRMTAQKTASAPWTASPVCGVSGHCAHRHAAAVPSPERASSSARIMAAGSAAPLARRVAGATRSRARSIALTTTTVSGATGASAQRPAVWASARAAAR